MTTVVGLFATRGEADRAIEALRAAGFAAGDLGVIAREPSLAEGVRSDIEADRGDLGAVAGGGLIGGVAGLIAGLGAVVVPGLGPILAAGPIAAALAGTAVGAAAGGMIGALVAHGVPREHADYYTQALEQGLILVTVHADEAREAEARRVLADSGSVDAGPRDEPEREGPRLTARAVEEATVPVGVGVGSVAGLALGDGGPSLTYREAEPRFRRHWESTRTRPASFEEVGHAYRYGWESRDDPAHAAKSWDEVSERLASGWTGRGEWHEHAPLVREAWESRGRG